MKAYLQPAMALDAHGIVNVSRVFWNLTTPQLYEEAVRRREGLVAHAGPLVCRTGHHTGRSPNDKFVVRDAGTADRVWWGKVNRALSPENFEALHNHLLTYLEGKELFVQDCYAGADPTYRLPIRVITENALHSLFARHMFIPERDPAKLEQHHPEFTVIDTPRFHGDPAIHGTNSEVFIIINFAKGVVLIGGTSYAGEIKKSIFTVMNYLLPFRQVMPMHCSANIGAEGDTALFFGLSGTGKTTLSSDPDRQLIGDDEHGWSDRGVFNFEGGCYAKMIKLSPEASRRSTPRRGGSAPCSRTSGWTRRRAVSTSTTNGTRRTRAAPTRSRSSRTRCPRAWAGTPATSCSSRPTPSACCPPSPG
jgi:phosphoenolpyruvate carboxykinase (ATP)